jgi:hypothetical protein
MAALERERDRGPLGRRRPVEAVVEGRRHRVAEANERAGPVRPTVSPDLRRARHLIRLAPGQGKAQVEEMDPVLHVDPAAHRGIPEPMLRRQALRGCEVLEGEMLKASERPAARQLDGEPVKRVMTQDVVDRYANARALGRGQGRACLLERRGEWFLDEDMLPAFGGPLRDRTVEIRRRCDVDDVHGRVAKQCLDVRIGRRPGRRDRVRAGSVCVHHRDHPRVREPLEGSDAERREPTRADDPDAERPVQSATSSRSIVLHDRGAISIGSPAARASRSTTPSWIDTRYRANDRARAANRNVLVCVVGL